MNILRDALLKNQLDFIIRCLAAILWIGGITLVFWVNWLIGLGFLLMVWGDGIAAKVAVDGGK